jgi:adenosylcobinamide amidohydrolase
MDVMAFAPPTLTDRPEGGLDVPLLVWRFGRPLLAISSGPLGGGLGIRHWAINATVPMSYHRDDPDAHLAELARGLDLDGPGVGLLTGVDVADLVTEADSGVTIWATVGLGAPIWAAEADSTMHPLVPQPAPVHPLVPQPATVHPLVPQPAPVPPASGRVGTVNLVGYVPVRLSEAALVNAVATMAEAKAQALWELGIQATGTATDASCLLCPVDGPDRVETAYGGPRSLWGARIARAVRQAIHSGATPARTGSQPWSDKLAH